MRTLQNRLDMVLEKIESPNVLKNAGLGNEIGFWIFDYPAKHELLVREHLQNITDKLQRRGYKFAHINVYQTIIDMLESRNLFERACQREKKVDLASLKKNLSGVLSQEKIARFISEQHQPETLDFVILSGLGNAWPLVRGHELLSALQSVMGTTPLILFYPGKYSGKDLHPFELVESKNYYRAFELIPVDKTSQSRA